MKLRNKKTGEIKECVVIPIDDNGYPNEYQVFDKRDSLAELNEEWEDVSEEPKDVWWLDNEGNVNHASRIDEYCFKKNKEIGNYFSSREEAEKAVKKLKAWKRLECKGFINEQVFNMNLNWCNPDDDDWKDFHLLFGGEE